METQQHEMEIRVRYSETDAMGFLHHANYLDYFEVGRTELYRARGGNYRELEANGMFLVVVKLTCHYKIPARYDDVLLLKTRVARLTPAKLEHDYELWRDDELLATSHTVLACVNRAGAVQRIPQAIISRVED